MKLNIHKLSYHVLIGFIAYKILSLLSNMVLSYKYGASVYSDAFIIAQALPVFIAAAVIALSVGLFYNQAKKEKRINVTLAIAIMVIIAAAISTAVLLFAAPAVKIFAYGFDDNAIAATSDILKITVFTSIPILVICLIKSYAKNLNASIAIIFESAPVYLAIIIGVLISGADSLNILGISVLSGFALAAVLMIFLLYKNKNKSADKSELKKEDIKYYIVFLAPVCLNLLIYQIVYYFDRNIASTLSAGSISSMAYSQNLIQIITAVLFFIITLNFFSMKKSIAKNDYQSAQESMLINANNIMLVFVPVSLFIICFANPIVMGIFERGAFRGPNSVLTSQIFVAYALGMLPMAFKFVLDNIFFSFNDRKTPTIASVIAILLNIGLDFLLVIPFKLFGIALASAIAYVVAATLMTLKLKSKIGTEHIVLVVKNMLKVLISGIPISIITLIVFSGIFYSMKSTLAHIIICMTLAAIVFILGYRFTLKRICDDVSLKVNIIGLKEKEIIYYPVPVTGTVMEIGYEIIKDAQYNEDEVFRVDIMNLEYVKKVVETEFAKKIIKKSKKFLKESIPEYYSKVKTALYNTGKNFINFIKDKINKSEKKDN